MSTLLKLLTVVYIFCVVIKCEILDLNVRRLDRNLIAKKRQDTLEMCRVFTAENAKIDGTNVKIIPSYKTKAKMKRVKRQVDMKYAVNPALKEEDERRVENIVDKLYDDMVEKGEKVTYRHNIINSTTTQSPTTVKKMHRRLFFAPAVLAWPEKKKNESARLEGTTDTPIVQKARWQHGIIPYFIDSKTYDAHLQQIITKAFDYIEKATCIRLQKLRERPTDNKSLQDVGWIYITNPSGIRQCVHSNEKRKINGVQMIVFGYDCMSRGDIVHEVMHILGFSHEHTRSDRDQYVSILWDNIKPGYKKYFELNNEASEYNLQSLPYDYASVLHYPPRAFSRNGQLTLIADSGVRIGQRVGLSEIDVQKVGLVYSSECVERNRDYLLKTCPSVVKSKDKQVTISQKEIDNYFKDRLWPLGVVAYKLRDKAEFSVEEILNLKAVFRHISKETCIQFKDITEDSDLSEESQSPETDEHKSEDDQTSEELVHNITPEIIVIEPKANTNVVELNTDNAGVKVNAIKAPKDVISEENIKANEIGTESSKENQLSKLRSVVEPGVNSSRIEVKAVVNSSSNKPPVSLPEPIKRVRRQAPPPKPERRHSAHMLVLTRTPIPGCKCPPPGKQDGYKVLEINADCFNSVNDLLHVFVHVLGLDHQHNMHDRDEYLHIVWRNLNQDIKKEMQTKLPAAASVGFPYDYQSVMHYPWLQIKEGVTNIMYPIWNDGWAMGHWQGLSSLDVQKLNLLYFSQCVDRQKAENE